MLDHSIRKFKMQLREFNPELDPECTRLRPLNGPELPEDKSVADICLCYSYINGRNQPIPQLEARTRNLKQSQSFVTLTSPMQAKGPGHFSPIINQASKDILKRSGQIYNRQFEKRLYSPENIRKKQKKLSDEIEKKYRYTYKPKINEFEFNDDDRWMDIHENLYKDGLLLKEKLKNMTINLKDKYEKPKELTRPRRPLKMSHSFANIHEKLYNDRIVMDQNKKDLIKKEMSQFVFKPKIELNESLKDNPKMMDRITMAKEGAYEKLLYRSPQQWEEVRKDMQSRWESRYLDERVCTFKPRINVKPAKTFEEEMNVRKQVLSRLLEPKEIPIPPKNPNCTFKPRINNMRLNFKK